MSVKVDGQLINGWVKLELIGGQSWSYLDANNITVPNTDNLRRDLKIRLKQGGGYKYFIIATVVSSTQIQVISLEGDTVANSAITDIWISSNWSPRDFGDNTPAVVVRQGTSQTISNNTITNVHFDTVDYDNAGTYDTSNHRYVVPLTGLYEVTFNFRYTDINGCNVRGLLYFNGTSRFSYNKFNYVALDSVSITGLYRVILGQYIEIKTYQNSGGNGTLANADNSYATIKYIGAS